MASATAAQGRRSIDRGARRRGDERCRAAERRQHETSPVALAAADREKITRSTSWRISAAAGEGSAREDRRRHDGLQEGAGRAAGDFEKAVDGCARRACQAAAKKAGASPTEGTVERVHPRRRQIGVLVEVNCETDFVARTTSSRRS